MLFGWFEIAHVSGYGESESLRWEDQHCRKLTWTKDMIEINLNQMGKVECRTRSSISEVDQCGSARYYEPFTRVMGAHAALRGCAHSSNATSYTVCCKLPVLRPAFSGESAHSSSASSFSLKEAVFRCSWTFPWVFQRGYSKARCIAR